MGTIRGEIGGEVHGTVGDVTVTTWKGMKVAKRKRGPAARPATESQQAQRDQFARASDYAKEVAVDAAKKALYEALAKGQPTTWRALAVQDYLTPPIVVRVDARDYHGKVGDRLDVFIHDQTAQSVQVRLLSPSADQPPAEPGQEPLGTVVEEGAAERAVAGQDTHWIYRATAALPGSKFLVVVEAQDLPGNVGTTTLEGEA